MKKAWTETTVGSIADAVMGQSPPSSTYNSIGDGLPFFQGKADFTSLNPVPSKWCTKPLRRASRNDVLISVRAPVGDVNMSSSDCCIGRGLSALSCKSDASPFFLFFFLLSSKEELQRHGTGTTFQSINKKVLEQLAISLPPLPEQKKIAAVLLKIQRAIETQEKIIQSVRDLKKSTMQHLFTHGLRGEKTKMTEIGEIPESWEVVTLGSCCEFLSGGTPSKSRADFWGVPIPWASPKDMKQERLSDTQDHITDAGLKDGSRLAPAGSLFVVVRGMVLAKDVPVSLTEVPMAFNQDMKAVLAGDDMDAKYLLYAMQAFKYLLSQNVGRSAHGTRTILSSTLSEFRIPRPWRPEQRRIANGLSILEEKVIVHSSKKSALQDLFKTTLNKLMTGRIRVQDLNIDVIEVD
jgi:type I restriction enzyme S subunit